MSLDSLLWPWVCLLVDHLSRSTTVDQDALDALIAVIVEQAERWSDPSYDVRREAISRTLSCDNVFTEAAMEFAVDQQMSELTRENLTKWVRGRRAAQPGIVAVLGAGNLPLVDLQDWLAVVLSGHQFVGVSSSRSPYLLRAFADSVRRHHESRFTDLDSALGVADRVIATGNTETMKDVRDAATTAGIPPEQILVRGSGFGVAVLTGNESADQWLDLAEDCLLHEGRGCRNVAVVFAPEGLSPDAFLDAAATWRGVFPAHARTPGALAIPKAMLEALQQPCAYADDLSFLVSAGDPEVKEPCHVRWAAYANLAEVAEWIDAQKEAVQIVATELAPDRIGLTSGARLVAPIGSTQHPPVDWQPDGKDTIAFLCRSAK